MQKMILMFKKRRVFSNKPHIMCRKWEKNEKNESIVNVDDGVFDVIGGRRGVDRVQS